MRLAPAGRSRPLFATSLFLIAFAAILLLAPAAAFAVRVTAPPDVYEKTDITVSLSASDSAGLAVLLVDGSVARSAMLDTATPVTFKDVLLVPGRHELAALVRSDDGLAEAAPVVVRSWSAPTPPTVSGTHAGIYHVKQQLTVTAHANTTRITALLNGRKQWVRAVSAGTKVSYTYTLPAGADTLELKADNPCGVMRSTKVQLQRPVWPVVGSWWVGSEFGPRDGRMHKGIDIHADMGATVVAIAPGKVIWAENLTSYGGLILVDHGGHVVSYYAHLSRIIVKLGQDVKTGQKIGEVGNTGNAAGGATHLHFQVYANALGWSDTSDKYRRVNSGIWTDPRLWVGFP